MHVSLGNEGVTWKTSVKTSLVSRNHGMIPSYTVFQGCSRQSKIAALQNGHFGLKLHRNNDLVTVVEVMPSIIEQACRSDGTTFWLGG